MPLGPLAAAIAVYATAAGWPVVADQVSPRLALMVPLFIDVGRALGLVLAGAFRPVPGRRSWRPLKQFPVNTAVNTANAGFAEVANTTSDTANIVPFAPVRASTRQEVGERRLALLRERGGMLEGSVRSLAELIHATPSTLHAAPVELEKLGLIAVDAGPGGSVFRRTG